MKKITVLCVLLNACASSIAVPSSPLPEASVITDSGVVTDSGIITDSGVVTDSGIITDSGVNTCSASNNCFAFSSTFLSVIRVENPVLITPRSITISTWIKLQELTSQQYFFQRKTSGPGGVGSYLMFMGNVGNSSCPNSTFLVRFHVGRCNGRSIPCSDSTDFLDLCSDRISTVDRWYHLLASYDEVTGTGRFFVNNIMQDIGTKGSGLRYPDPTQPISIGYQTVDGMLYSGGVSRSEMTNLTILDHPASDLERYELTSRTYNVCNSLVSWPLNQVAGTLVSSYGLHPYPGTVINYSHTTWVPSCPTR